MKKQLESWQGQFGQAYTERNQVEWQPLVPYWETMVGGLEIARVLEIGCNRGHNLVALGQVLGEGATRVGVDPNRHALQIAKRNIDALEGNAYDLPFKDGWFDLAFTAGVLIHVPLADLGAALDEIYRVSRRYILAMEYFAEEETVIPYRGHDDLLWKRNFLKCYQDRFPDLKVVREGYWEELDRSHWWLLEKAGAR